MQWVEQRDNSIRNNLLHRLGFQQPETVDAMSIKIGEQPDKIKQAIGSIGLDSETVYNYQKWVDENPAGTVATLLTKMLGTVEEPRRIHQNKPHPEANLPGKPAVLPPGQPQGIR